MTYNVDINGVYGAYTFLNMEKDEVTFLVKMALESDEGLTGTNIKIKQTDGWDVPLDEFMEEGE